MFLEISQTPPGSAPKFKNVLQAQYYGNTLCIDLASCQVIAGETSQVLYTCICMHTVISLKRTLLVKDTGIPIGLYFVPLKKDNILTTLYFIDIS